MTIPNLDILNLGAPNNLAQKMPQGTPPSAVSGIGDVQPGMLAGSVGDGKGAQTFGSPQGSKSQFAQTMASLSGLAAKEMPETVPASITGLGPTILNNADGLGELEGLLANDSIGGAQEIEQLALALGQLSEETLLSIYQMLLGKEIDPQALSQLVSTQPSSDASEVTVIQDRSEQAQMAFPDNSPSVAEALSNGESLPVVNTQLTLGRQALTDAVEVMDRTAADSNQLQSKLEIIAAIRTELTALANTKPHYAEKLVDHLKQLFPELNINSADLSITLECEVEEDVATKIDGIRSFLDEQGLKSQRMLSSRQNIAVTGQHEQRNSQINPDELQSIQDSKAKADASFAQTTDSGPSKQASPELAVHQTQRNVTAGLASETFKTLEGSDKNSKNADFQLGDFSAKGDAKIKLDNPQPGKAVASTPDVESFRIVMRRAHIDALLQRGEVKLQLQPDHLGSMKVELHRENSQMMAKIETSSHEARNIVEHNLPQLRESFEKLGLKLGQIDVTVNDHRMSQQQGRFEHAQRGNQKRFGGIVRSEQVEASPAASLSSAPLYAGGLNLLA